MEHIASPRDAQSALLSRTEHIELMHKLKHKLKLKLKSISRGTWKPPNARAEHSRNHKRASKASHEAYTCLLHYLETKKVYLKKSAGAPPRVSMIRFGITSAQSYSCGAGLSGLLSNLFRYLFVCITNARSDYSGWGSQACRHRSTRPLDSLRRLWPLTKRAGQQPFLTLPYLLAVL